MRYQDFIAQVMTGSDFDSQERAVEVTVAVLATLGERLEETETTRMAAQLPLELRQALLRREDTQNKYDLEEFYNRVSARANVGYPEAVKLSLTVIGVLCRAISKGEIDDVKGKLPDQYRELFGRSPEGALSPTVLPSDHVQELEQRP